MKNALTSVAVDPNDGEQRWFLGTLATIKIGGEQSGGRLAIFESLLPRESAPPLHTHPQDETFYILEGEMTVWLNGVPKHCSAGTTVFFPGGTPHTFFVESEIARVLVLSTPAGIEQFVRGLSQPAKEMRLPDDAEDYYPERETIEKIFAAYGAVIVGPAPTLADISR